MSPTWYLCQAVRFGIIQVVFVCLIVSAGTGATRPNIVFIMADDLGWFDVGYHGSEIRTPHIDRLAASGVKLENYYTQPLCGPSRSAFLSGRYPINIGLQHKNLDRNRPHGLPLHVTTIADRLKASGYSTHLVGKWHQGYFQEEYMPTNRGFDTFYGMLNGNGHYYKHCTFHEKNCARDLYRNDEIDMVDNATYSGYLFTTEAQMIIRDNARVNKPFFLFLSHQLVHNPNDVPDRYFDQFPEIKNRGRRLHAGMTSCLDESINNVTNTLIEYGLWNNTILIFSTDNGGRAGDGGFNTPLRGQKKGLWEGGIRGPAFVVSPLLPDNRRGVVVDSLFHISDWYPTFVRLAGGSVAGLDLDSFDMWPAIRNGERGMRTELLHNIDQMAAPVGGRLHEDTFDNRIRAAIRSGRWKLLTGNPGQKKWYSPDNKRGVDASNDNRNKNIWLFDILRDPSEHNDLSVKRQDVVRRLLDKLARYNRTSAPIFYPPVSPLADPSLTGGVWGPWLPREPSTTPRDMFAGVIKEFEKIEENDDEEEEEVRVDGPEPEDEEEIDSVFDNNNNDKGKKHSVNEVSGSNGRNGEIDYDSVYYHISVIFRLVHGLIPSFT